MINIDELIKNATLSKDRVALNAYKNIKAEQEKFIHAQILTRKLDKETQLRIIANYSKKLEDAIKQFLEAHRDDLVSEYTNELEVVKKLLPAPVESEDIEYRLYNWADELNFMDYSGEGLPRITIPKKEMGNAIKHVKSRFPTADGKMISEIVKKYLV